MVKDPYICDSIPNYPTPPPQLCGSVAMHACVKPIPYPHPPPYVCRASTGFCWTVTAYSVLSSAGMEQGFAGPARLIPPCDAIAGGVEVGGGGWGGGGGYRRTG